MREEPPKNELSDHQVPKFILKKETEKSKQVFVATVQRQELPSAQKNILKEGEGFEEPLALV